MPTRLEVEFRWAGPDRKSPEQGNQCSGASAAGEPVLRGQCSGSSAAGPRRSKACVVQSWKRPAADWGLLASDEWLLRGEGRDAVRARIGLESKTKTAALRRPFRVF